MLKLLAFISLFSAVQPALASRPCVIQVDDWLDLITPSKAREHNLELVSRGSPNTDFLIWTTEKNIDDRGMFHLPGAGKDQYRTVIIADARTNEVIASKDVFAAHWTYGQMHGEAQWQKVWRSANDPLHRKMARFVLKTMGDITCE